MGEARVHERVMRRYPELSEEDVICAWRNAFVVQRRWRTNPAVIAAVGADWSGRVLELVALELEDGNVLIYHALTPPTGKTISELGLG